MKRFIALVLSLVMALSLCVPAWAEGGTTVTVKTADDLKALSAKALTGNNGAAEEATIVIDADIDMQGAEFNSIVAQYGDKLTIVGNGHKISNAKIVSGANDNTTGQAGMFYAYTGSTLTVSDLTLENITVTADADGSGYAAAVVGYCEGAAVLNNVDVVNATVKGEKSSGMLAGHVGNGGTLTATNCDVTGTVTLVDGVSGGHYAGKYIGTMGGDIALTDCTANVTVSGNLNAANIGDVYGRKVSGSLTVDGVAFVANTDELQAAINSGVAKIVLGEGEFTADLYVVPANKDLTITGQGAKTTLNFSKEQVRLELFDSLTIENCTMGRMLDKKWGQLVFGSSTKAGGVYTVSNCIFNGKSTQGIYINQNVAATFNIEGCTFAGKFGGEGAIVVQNNSTPTALTLNVSGNTFAVTEGEELAIFYHKDKLALNLSSDVDETVLIKDNSNFKTAVATADAGDTFKLTVDVNAADVVVDKPLNINTNGCTLTGLTVAEGYAVKRTDAVYEVYKQENKDAATTTTTTSGTTTKVEDVVTNPSASSTIIDVSANTSTNAVVMEKDAADQVFSASATKPVEIVTTEVSVTFDAAAAKQIGTNNTADDAVTLEVEVEVAPETADADTENVDAFNEVMANADEDKVVLLSVELVDKNDGELFSKSNAAGTATVKVKLPVGLNTAKLYYLDGNDAEYLGQYTADANGYISVVLKHFSQYLAVGSTSTTTTGTTSTGSVTTGTVTTAKPALYKLAKAGESMTKLPTVITKIDKTTVVGMITKDVPMYVPNIYNLDGDLYIEVAKASATHALKNNGAYIYLYDVNLTSAEGIIATYATPVVMDKLVLPADEDVDCGDCYKIDNAKKVPAAYYVSGDDVYYPFAGTGTPKFAYMNGEFVAYDAVSKVDFEKHVWDAKSIIFRGTDVKGAKIPVSIACENCEKTFSVVDKTKFDNTWVKFVNYDVVENGEAGYDTMKGYYIVLNSATSAGTTVKPSTDKIQSADTFDAGIAMYVGMSVMAAAGSAVVIGKKRED